MSGSSEVLVLGGGMAGATAALAAASRGKSVTLLQKAPGATALSSGAIDLAPPLSERRPGAAGDPLAATDVRSWIEQLAARARGHPYEVVGEEGRALFSDAVDLVLGRLGDAGLEHAPVDMSGPGHLVIDVTGCLRRVAGAQTSQVLEAPRPSKARLGVLFLRPCLGVDTGLVIKNLSRFFGEVHPVELHWPGEEDAPFLLPAELGRRLDEPRERASLFDELRKAVGERKPTHLVIPPMGGFERTADLSAALGDVIGAKVVETLGGEASLPGLRLHSALAKALSTASVRVERAAVSEGSRKLSGHDGAVVLATGRFIGGGLRRSGHLEEALFDLPVFDGSRRLLDEPSEVLTSRAGMTGHSLFRAGIRVDGSLRPLALGGRKAREGLFAAGSVIGTHDPHGDRCGMGVAILTGYLAGIRAAEWRRS